MAISKVDIGFSVAMQGPFKLSDGISVRRVSLILWLCIQRHGFRKMLIPHFLDLSTEDADTYLKFLKADHQLEDDEVEYQLKPANGRAAFNRATHGTLFARNFCFTCISISVLPNECTKYYLGGGIRSKRHNVQIIYLTY